ncbi:MAG: type II toxin-antitoxin system RelE/ParE family toxin [Phycisphaerae bacterium]|nr:type II toxin-antitoxin system RelE/ParE family toxin [Tepidisphaeraceae bacterium]
MPEASADILAAYRYIAGRSPQNAELVAERLFAAIDSLEFLPRRSKVHRSHIDPNRVVRSTPVRPYIIYYRVREADAVVEILTVRHGARGDRPEFD